MSDKGCRFSKFWVLACRFFQIQQTYAYKLCRFRFNLWNKYIFFELYSLNLVKYYYLPNVWKLWIENNNIFFGNCNAETKVMSVFSYFNDT